MIRFIRDPQPPHIQFKQGMVRDLGPSLETLFIGLQDAVSTVEPDHVFPPPRVSAPAGTVPADPVAAAGAVVGTVGLVVTPIGPKYAGQVVTGTLTGAIASGFQWYRDDAAISGANNVAANGRSSLYTVHADDVVPGVELSVRPIGLTLKGSAGVASATPPAFVTPPSFSAPPQVGVQVTFSGGSASGVPTPTITTTLAVGGAQVNLPFTPSGGDVARQIVLTSSADNIGGTATASAVATIAAAPPGPVPVNSALPAITGTAQEGQTLTVSNGTWSNSPTGYTRQWLRGATPIGSGASTYALVLADVGATISCAVTAINANGSSTPATSAPTAAVAAATPAADTRPRFFVAPANAYTTNTAALVAGATRLSGSANGGKSGTLSLTTTAGNFGWIAVLASAVGAGIRVFDGLGYGGWSGAGQAGNFAGVSTDPSTPTQPFADGDGNTWALIRQDYINGNPTAATYTVS